ncbi:DNA ligase [Shewanella avicenniae]|uniref:DNA ligase n=1 Tax=Shewanella avicenniae TaxID=2814294 RepID=A0ABX7QU87_9GAMM|nr:DNA ligase [Shewanella avicenniae]QSX35054.1 DNA ligase [Shewanella avicenniae]
MSLFAACVRLVIFPSLLLSFAVAQAASPSLHQLPNPELASVWQAQASPADYLVSEKLDGVRARWDGQRLYSRSGMVINAPSWFIAGFPNEPLEGELWAGYGSFEQVSLAARGGTDAERWRSIQYWLFDAPAALGDFEQRYQHFQAFDGITPYLKVIPQQRGTDIKSLQQQLDDIVSRGGEGLILHYRKAPIVAGRSPYVFKFKPVDDAEAKVLAVLPGKGKYNGMMGALLVEMANGVRFKIGSGFSDQQRQYPPAIGSWITFEHNGFTASGKPRFARFVRVRLDYQLSHDAP